MAVDGTIQPGSAATRDVGGDGRVYTFFAVCDVLEQLLCFGSQTRRALPEGVALREVRVRRR